MNSHSKIFGFAPLLIAVPVFGVFFILCLMKANLVGLIVFVAFIIFRILFVNPIFYLKGDYLTVIFLNPFKKKVVINLKKISKVVFEVDGRYDKISFISNEASLNIEAETPLWEVKKIYKYFLSTGINVESKGVGAIDWNP